jgi:2-hydroxychromene-2-carboxylate isomerase
VAPILNSNYAELRKAGHYQSAMIHYRDTWYGGIDRLPYLEAALTDDLGAASSVLAPRAEADRGPLKLSDKPLVCELWLSFHSPYSYLALERIEQILAPHAVPIVLKPIAPVVSRVPVPAIKRQYIVRDAKREADRLGVAFGELCDPPGKGIESCLAIAHWAGARGHAMAFARSAMRGIWAEALDVSAYVDLRRIVERAGLSWAEARAALDSPEAAKAAQAHAAELAVFNLWDAPSIRCGDFITWGHDRLPLLADRLRRHALVVG